MRAWCAVLLCVLSPCAVQALSLSNTLGEDQRAETLSVEIDGRVVGRLKLDAEHLQATLRLPAGARRYRLQGTAEMSDGTRLTVAGAGLIVSVAEMDRIGEAGRVADALAAYEDLVRALQAAAPEVDLSALPLTRGRPVSESELAAAERRLGTRLPAGYREQLRTLGALTVGPPDAPSGRLYGPDALDTLQAWVLARAAENDSSRQELRAIEAFIGKRFRPARQDLVLGVWERDEPTLVRAGERCPSGETPYAFPETQWEVLMGAGLDDNAFMGLISYEDDIVGETQCLSFDRELAYSLHDHLIELGRDALYVIGPDETRIAIQRRDIDRERIWLGLTEGE